MSYFSQLDFKLLASNIHSTLSFGFPTVLNIYSLSSSIRECTDKIIPKFVEPQTKLVHPLNKTISLE